MSTQEQPLLGRRGMPLAANSAATARPRRHLPWERQPRALDVQEPAPVLPAAEDAAGLEGFEQTQHARDEDRQPARRDPADAPAARARSAPQPLPAPQAALPAAQPPAAEPSRVAPPRTRQAGTEILPPPVQRESAAAAAPPAMRGARTRVVTRIVEKQTSKDAAQPLPLPIAPTAATRIIQCERQVFGKVAEPPSSAPVLVAPPDEPSPAGTSRLIIDRILVSPAAVPIADTQDAAALPAPAATTALPQPPPQRRMFGQAAIQPPPVATPTAAVSLSALRGTSEAPSLSIGSLHVEIKPSRPPLAPHAAVPTAQPRAAPAPTPPTPARTVRSAYRNPWFAARRVE